MTKKHKHTDSFSAQESGFREQDAPVIAEPSKPTVADVKDAQPAPVKKKRIRHRQTVKLHNKKLSVSVICANPYLRQFL